MATKITTLIASLDDFRMEHINFSFYWLFVQLFKFNNWLPFQYKKFVKLCSISKLLSAEKKLIAEIKRLVYVISAENTTQSSHISKD